MSEVATAHLRERLRAHRGDHRAAGLRRGRAARDARALPGGPHARGVLRGRAGGRRPGARGAPARRARDAARVLELPSGGMEERRLGRLEVLGAWLGVWTPPREAVVPPVPWRPIAAAAALLAVALLAGAALLVPAILDDRERAGDRAREAAQRRHAQALAAADREQRPRTGRGAADPGAGASRPQPPAGPHGAAGERPRRAPRRRGRPRRRQGRGHRLRAVPARLRPAPAGRGPVREAGAVPVRRGHLALRRGRPAGRDRDPVPARRRLRRGPLRVLPRRAAVRPRPPDATRCRGPAAPESEPTRTTVRPVRPPFRIASSAGSSSSSEISRAIRSSSCGGRRSSASRRQTSARSSIGVCTESMPEQRDAAQDERHHRRLDLHAGGQAGRRDRAAVADLREQARQHGAADAVDRRGPALLAERLAVARHVVAPDDLGRAERLEVLARVLAGARDHLVAARGRGSRPRSSRRRRSRP